MKRKLIIITLLLGHGTAKGGSEKPVPPLPYYNWGACPFECCTYREWSSNAPTHVLSWKNKNAPVVFELQKGEKVQGVTGVVITTRPGEAEVLKTTQLGEQKLKVVPGEVVYILHYEGEGFFKFWVRGQVDSDEFPDKVDPSSRTGSVLRTIRKAETTWWVKVRNSRGQTGWTTETNHFDHMDACE